MEEAGLAALVTSSNLIHVLHMPVCDQVLQILQHKNLPFKRNRNEENERSTEKEKIQQIKKLLGAPGLTTRNKKLLGAPGIITRK